MHEYTKEELKRIVLGWSDGCGRTDITLTEEESAWAKENIVLVQRGEDVVEHKSVYNSNIYSVNGFFFDVTFTRDNCGYWGDGESYPPEIYEVKPVQVTKTEYHVVH